VRQGTRLIWSATRKQHYKLIVRGIVFLMPHDAM